MNNFDKNEGSEKEGAGFETREEIVLPDAESQIDEIDLRAGESGAARMDELASLTDAGDPLRAQAAEIIAQTDGELKKAGEEAKKQIGKVKKGNPKVKHGVRKVVPMRKFGPAVVPQRKKEKKEIILPSEKKAMREAEQAAEERRRLVEGIRRLDAYRQKMALELRDGGVPVDDECRIDETAFASVFTKDELFKDADYVNTRERQFGPDEVNLDDPSKLIHLGPVMEKFVTALLYKLFKDRFIICQASRYDDIHNGIDTVIIDKKTGAVVGAFDAVLGGDDSQRKQQKDTKTFIKNHCKAGETLRYGLDVAGEGGDKRPVPCLREGVPVLVLNLKPEELIKGLTRVDLSKASISEIERNLMDKLIESLDTQIKDLEFFRAQKENKNSDLSQIVGKLKTA